MTEAQYDSIAAVQASAAFAAARQCVHDTDPRTVAEMREVTAIAAPTGAETERGRWFAARLRELDLEVEVDDVGNVIAVTPATHPDAGQVVVAAHLDTVFAADTDLTLRSDGDHSDGGRLSAPGISDNGRGLAALLALARALHAAGWPTRAPVALVATVGEEGAGDLRGAKHLMQQRADGTAAFIALDGAGASRIIHAGVGSRRLRVTWRVRGGHSWADWGDPNAVHAMGRAVASLATLDLPTNPRTTLTVARAGGGTSINAIPAEAWVEIDLRSEGRAPLRELETRVRDLLQRAATQESRAGETVSCDIVIIGDRPPGGTPTHHPLVDRARDATRALGFEPELTSSSTDANVAMSLNIPAVAIGAGGAAGGMHTTDEWYENEDGPAGVERALLLVMSVAGVAAE